MLKLLPTPIGLKIIRPIAIRIEEKGLRPCCIPEQAHAISDSWRDIQFLCLSSTIDGDCTGFEAPEEIFITEHC